VIILAADAGTDDDAVEEELEGEVNLLYWCCWFIPNLCCTEVNEVVCDFERSEKRRGEGFVDNDAENEE